MLRHLQVVVCILFFLLSVHGVFAQKDSILRKKNYKTWVFTKDNSLLKVGILYKIQDSSIIILDVNPSYRSMIKHKQYSIDLESIDLIQLRRKNKIGIAVALGASIGYALGFTGAYLYVVNTPKAGVEPFAFSLFGACLGTAIGLIIGSLKIKIPIHGDKNIYNIRRKELNKYAKCRYTKF